MKLRNLYYHEILCCSCLLCSLDHHFNSDSQPRHGQIICPICMHSANAFLDFVDSDQIEIEEPIILPASRLSGDTFDDALRDATIYRISSYKTRGYYFFAGPSTAGIIRTRVLFEGVYYSKRLPFLENKARVFH